MNRPDISQIDLLTFDCYGTLIDWESGILAALTPVLSSHGVTMSGESLLELFAKLESAAEQGNYCSYRTVLDIVMRQLAATLEFRLESDEPHLLADSIKYWPAFHDTEAALRKLHERVNLAVISNIDDDLFAASHQKLGVTLDHVITAEKAGAYKPSREMFDYAFSQLPVPKERILHVAQSLFHDIAPCNDIGIDCVWVNRRKSIKGSGATPPTYAEPTWQVASMAELAELIVN